MWSRHRTLNTILRLYLNRSGSTAVEFALLAPLYIFLLMGMTAYGIYFGASHSVQQLAADAARTAIAGITTDEREELAGGFVARNAAGYPFIDPSRLLVRVNASPTDSNQFDVVIRFDASRLPIWGLFEGLPIPDKIIEKRSTIRIGGI